MKYEWFKATNNYVSAHNTQNKIYFFRPIKESEKVETVSKLASNIEERFKYSKPLED